MSSLLDRCLKRRLGTAVLAVLLAALPVFLGIRGVGQWQDIGGYLGYTFIRRALLVGGMVSLCAALLGVVLVLKHYSMIGDGLSHVGFGGLTVAVALGSVSAASLPAFLPEGLRMFLASLCGTIAATPVPFTMIIVVACAVFLLRLDGEHGDSAVAMLSTASLAVGVTVTSVSSGMNVDVYNYMFGSILAVSAKDVWFAMVLSVVVLIVFIVLCPRLFAVTFDESFAMSSGMNVHAYNLIIAVLTAIMIVLGMRIMGTMLISSLIIFPALTSMRLCSRFRSVLILAGILSVVSFVTGIMLSCVYALPAGAGIVIVDLYLWLGAAVIQRLRSRG